MTCSAERHGTVYAYRNFRCRCQEARDRIAAEKARYRIRQYVQGPQLVDKTGTLRRVQALMWLGWPCRDIAAKVGYKRPDDLIDPARLISRTYADRIRALYDEIGLREGPSARVRMLAQRRGYGSPLVWDEDSIDDPKARPRRNPRVERYGLIDPVAVEEAIAGRAVRLTDEERREVVRRLSARGLNARQIADRLGTSMKTVQRFRSRIAVRDAA